MKYFTLIIVFIVGLLGCETGKIKFGGGESDSSVVTVPTEKPAQSPVSKPSPSPAPASTDFKQKIFDIVAADDCSKEVYSNQGKAPAGYNKGLALTYAKVVCEPNSAVFKTGTSMVGASATDALAHYGLFSGKPEERLNTTFALMIGSNARESSWRPCVGRDIAASASDVKGCLNDGKLFFGSGSTCEAGLAQTSYNSVPKEGPLRDLFNTYKGYPKSCFRAEYYGKTTCSPANLENHGSDPQAFVFQKLSKECPGYTVESGVIMFRTKRTHYGPINTKKAEVKKSCIARFEKIRQLVVKNPDLCKSL